MTTATTSNPPSVPSGSSAPSSNPQLSALLNGAAIASLDAIGWIRVTGEDRVRWLNGMATNSVQDLPSGKGAYNFFLNAQGRIQGDGYIYASPDHLLIETSRAQIATLIPYLDHYIIMDDVELADVTPSRHGLTVIGPGAASLLQKLGLPVADLSELETRTLTWNSAEVVLSRTYGPLVPHYELWTAAPEETAALSQALKDLGAIPCEAGPLEWLRLLEGTPRYSVDVRDRDLPQETNQARALHFAKGCYLGQEIVERIRSRGSVHRTFTPFRLEGTLPVAGTQLESAGKQIGEITSVASIPLVDGPLQLALGYVRREALERNEPLQYPGGTALPISTPFLLEKAATVDSPERA